MNFYELFYIVVYEAIKIDHCTHSDHVYRRLFVFGTAQRSRVQAFLSHEQNLCKGFQTFKKQEKLEMSTFKPGGIQAATSERKVQLKDFRNLNLLTN